MAEASIKPISKKQPVVFRKAIVHKAAPLFLVLLVIFIIYLRDPRYFLTPRFWAEEATRHFAFSYSHDWLSALFQPQLGYLNFWPNLATLLATIPPMQTAPLVTTCLALVVQLLPVGLILWSKSPWWSGWVRKIAGIAIYLFLPLTSEVWLNTINSYNFFAVIAFLILLDDAPESQTRRWVYRVLLVLGGLTGTLACFLIPFFAYQLLAERKKERLVQVLLLSACAAVQLLLIFTYQTKGSVGQRFHLLGASTFATTLWTQGLGFFVIGYDNAQVWSSMLFAMVTDNVAAFHLWGRLLLAGGLIAFLLLSANLPLRQRILFLASYGILMLLPMMFSIIPAKATMMLTGANQRIFFAPNILLGWMLLGGARFSSKRVVSFRNLVSLLCVGVIGLGLFWGMENYPKQRAFSTYWPDWKTEVATWQKDPAYAMRIQPEGWVVNLQKK